MIVFVNNSVVWKLVCFHCCLFAGEDVDEWNDTFAKLRANNTRVDVLLDSLKWINVQAKLLDICIALYPLDLPPYVILEIVDRFPFWSTHVNHKKKIDYIIQIKRFCDALIDSRQ
jgi:hypothetical protein